MATRRELEQRKSNLQQEFRQAVRNGVFAQGETLPPVTQLAQQFRLSVAVVRQALQPLMAEGVLYTIPRVGTFVGRSPSVAPEFYVLVVPQKPSPGEYTAQVQIGFEDRIASLGGSSLIFEPSQIRGFRLCDDLPNPAGKSIGFDASVGIANASGDRRERAAHWGGLSEAVVVDRPGSMRLLPATWGTLHFAPVKLSSAEVQRAP